MSRIEDAMRRAGAAGPRPVPPPEALPTPPAEAPPAATATDAQAASPWEFEAGQPRVAPPPEPVPPPDIEPEAVALRPVVQSERMLPNLTSVLPVEQYRRLAATLHHAQTDRGVRVVMVTSALPREGKTLTSLNLALTLSESYRRRVLLIDADLRRPSLHDAFGVGNATGLSDGLGADDEQRLPLVQLSPTLVLLTGGRPAPDPMHMLASARMKKIIDEASENYDWVLLDTPPVALLPDANLLAAMVDGAVLVLHAGATPYAAAMSAIEAVGRDRILGVILNGADGQTAHEHYDGYAYRYGGYGSGPTRR